jgi:flagellar hook-length control protein FliK
MLAAMALPLMAIPVAAASMPQPAPGQPIQAGARGQAALAGVAQVAARAMTASPIALAGSEPLAAAVPGTLPMPAPAAQEQMVQAGTPDTGAGQEQAPAPGAAPASGEAGARQVAATSSDRGAVEQATPAAMPSTSAPASGWGIAASAPSQPAAPATVALAGPPAAWRQTLHEALGDRLQMQVGNNFQQAVIRLEPPDLGRIDIAIRHSAGTLEVALSATHGEVVRQLHSVSDNLRNDLAGRQYSEVTISVSQAPRAQQPGASAFADQQGRQRQGGREQDDTTPGLALADAGLATSTFSLNGRE